MYCQNSIEIDFSNSEWISDSLEIEDEKGNQIKTLPKENKKYQKEKKQKFRICNIIFLIQNC